MSARHSIPARLAALAATGAVALTVPIVMGFWGGIHPAFDSFAHFRVHLSVLVILLALPALFVNGWRLIGAATIALGAGAVMSVMLAHAGGEARAAQDPADGDARYSLLQLNLRYDNASPQEVLSLIGREQPDVITLDEVSDHWKRWLKLTEAAYPHRIICPPPSRIGGVAILSRRPFSLSRKATCHDRGSLAIARVEFGGRGVDVAALHLGWPWPFGQTWQVRRLAAPLSRLGSPAILAGDFNAVPWSMTARHVAEEGGLHILQGIGPTWLTRAMPNPLRPLVGLPIDNVLVKGDLVAGTPRRLEQVGSDHLPVLVRFGIEPGEGAPVLHAGLAQQLGK